LKDVEINEWSGETPAPTLAKFMVENVTPSYISHSELMVGRADDIGRWSDDLEEVLTSELSAYLAEAGGDNAPLVSVVIAKVGGKLAGLAILSASRGARANYGILEDVVVGMDYRKMGLLRGIWEFAEAKFRGWGVKRVFLESGKGNLGAHQAFHKLGFDEMSSVFVKGLAQ
jgi:GNAT superfamily N-acetyltransferase